MLFPSMGAALVLLLEQVLDRLVVAGRVGVLHHLDDFGHRVAVVDVRVRRVEQRGHGVPPQGPDPAAAGAHRVFFQRAQQALPVQTH